MVDRSLAILCIVSFCGFVFMIDSLSPIEIVMPELYLLVLPLIKVARIPRGYWLFALGTAALSGLGAVLSPVPTPTEEAIILAAVVNRAMLTGAIVWMSWLY